MADQTEGEFSLGSYLGAESSDTLAQGSEGDGDHHNSSNGSAQNDGQGQPRPDDGLSQQPQGTQPQQPDGDAQPQKQGENAEDQQGQNAQQDKNDPISQMYKSADGLDVERMMGDIKLGESLFSHELPQQKKGEPPPEPELPWYEQRQQEDAEHIKALQQNLTSPLEMAYQAIESGADPKQALQQAYQKVLQVVGEEEKQRQQKLLSEHFERGAQQEKTVAQKEKQAAAVYANTQNLAQKLGGEQQYRAIMFTPAYGGDLLNHAFDRETGGKYPPGEDRNKAIQQWFSENAADGKWLSMIAEAARGRMLAKRYPDIVQQLQRRWTADYRQRSEAAGNKNTGRAPAQVAGSQLQAWINKT